MISEEGSKTSKLSFQRYLMTQCIHNHRSSSIPLRHLQYAEPSHSRGYGVQIVKPNNLTPLCGTDGGGGVVAYAVGRLACVGCTYKEIFPSLAMPLQFSLYTLSGSQRRSLAGQIASRCLRLMGVGLKI